MKEKIGKVSFYSNLREMLLDRLEVAEESWILFFRVRYGLYDF